MVATSGPGWHLAPSLVGLFDEADHINPGRDHGSDGTIGDFRHQATVSDHNPDQGWVCAGDVDEDGVDVDLLRQHLVASQDLRVKYLIRNGTIWKAYPNRGFPAWAPQIYAGVNAHDKHLHISVWNTPAARGDRRPWWPQEDDMPSLEEIKELIDDAVADVKANADTIRDGVAAEVRRVLGVELMADSVEQHKADADTGARFQKLLDGS